MALVLGKEEVETGKEATDSERVEAEIWSCSESGGHGTPGLGLEERCIG